MPNLSHEQVEAMEKFLKWLKTYPFSEADENRTNYTISSMQNNRGDNCIHVKFFLREKLERPEVSEDVQKMRKLLEEPIPRRDGWRDGDEITGELIKNK
jgi:hypothetical protein